MKYSKEFPPNRGDRVAFEDGWYTYKGRIVGHTDTHIVVKHLVHGLHKKKWEDVTFLTAVPWWAFWQK